MQTPGSQQRMETSAPPARARTPNVLIVGAQKCGTHWLHASLKAHPDAFMSVEKEPHFFNAAERLTEAGFRAYLEEHFAGARDESVVGEASTGYFRTRNGIPPWCSKKRGVDVPSSVLRFLGPEVRLVVGLRQPVERAISAYLHHWGKGRIGPGESLIDASADYGIVDIGFYHRHLSRWTEVFARDRLHVVLLEDVHERPAEAFAALCAFLEIGPRAPQEGFAYKGFDLEWDGDRLVVSEEGEREIRRKLAENKLRGPADALPVIRAEELIELQRVFDEDIERLADWLGRDLAHWRGEPWKRFVRYAKR
jgi:hypothetical protein